MLYKFRNYDSLIKREGLRVFIEVILIDNITKEEKVMKQENVRLPMPPLDVPCAYINVKAGATVPIPKKRYHSARIDIGLSYPCHPEKIDEVYEKVSKWVDDRIAKEYAELTKTGPDFTEDKLEVL